MDLYRDSGAGCQRALMLPLILGLLLTSRLAWGQAGEQTVVVEDGALTVYGMPTEAGTVAVRESTDSAGRLLSSTYYTLKPLRRDLQLNPPDEADLRVQTIDRYTYDSTGHLIRTETMDGQGHPLRDLFTVYGADDLLRAEILCGGDGVRQVEKRYDTSEGLSVVSSVLTFDSSGERLVTFIGRLPEGMDLAGGWGPSDGGIACGLTASASPVHLDDARLTATLLNRSDETVMVSTGPAFYVLDLDVRAESGASLPLDTTVVETYANSVTQLSGERLASQPLPPEHGWTVATVELRQWYPAMTAGRYTVSARYRAAADLVGLLCNEVEIELTGPPSETDDYGR